MAAADGQQTLESLLCQITDPANQEDRWDCIQSFYQLVNQETDGPQAAIHLLSHKIQSPQEKEALQALTLLEACMNNCGKRFHGEVAKFRFLNELIKVLSPKYFGAWTSQTVKDRVTEVLYGWTLWLKDEPKIKEAYGMLKRQGIVEKDPKLPDTIIMAPPPQRTTQSVFDQEDKATLLARLLKSNRPEDLETANRLIKSTLKEEQEKAEKASKRESTLKEVESNTKALRGLLDQQKISGTLLDLSDDVKTVYERCDRMRPTLFRLASDTMDDDLALNQILEANDELTLVVNAFKEQVGRNAGRERSGSEEETEAKTNAPTSTREIKSYRLIDFSGLDSPETLRKADSPTPVFPPLMENDLDFNELDFENGLTRPSEGTPKSYYEELIQLNADFQVKSSEQNGGLVLRSRGCGEHCTTSNGTSDRSLPQNHQFTGFEAPSMLQKDLGQVSGSPRRSEHKPCPSGELKNIFVPLESIKSSHLEPVTLLDRGGIRVSLHFTVCPRSHPASASALLSEEVDKAEHELRVAQTEFDRQAEVTRLLLEGISSTHLNHLRCLHDFAEAQATYYAQCHHYMQDLQRELSRGNNAAGAPPAAAGGPNLSSSASSSHGTLTVEQLPVTGTRKAKVLYDYDAHDASELSLLADELITVYTLPGMDPDWLIGERGNNKGKVPVTYLELLS